MTERWSSLSRALAQVTAPDPPAAGGRVAAALALLCQRRDGDLELLLTRRRDDLRHHPGQVSFPGGRIEPGETIEQAALREAAEECALDPATVEPLGRLPAFYIPPSRFWLQVVVARWRRPHPLRAAEAEVAEILRVPLADLLDERRWRVVRRRHPFWAWQLDDDHLLWGATAASVVALLELVEPGWHGGRTPVDLPADREVRPWAVHAVPRGGPARLPGVPERSLEEVARRGGGALDAGRAVDAATAAALRLAPAVDAPRVLVLAGRGGTGALGIGVARALAARDVDAEVVAATDPGGTLPPADVVVDALVGRGLQGALRAPALDAVLALRGFAGKVLSLDLPSGLHPRDGLVGDLVAADVTLALGGLPPGLLAPGAGPYVGDLYVAGPAAGPDLLVRVTPPVGDRRALA